MINPFIPILNSHLPEPQASLLTGILFGTRVSIPKEFYNSLVVTGTLHIIALSGQNISILITLVANMTINLGKKFSSVVSIFSIILFVIFVGPSPSVVRAAMMGCLTLVAVLTGRASWGLLGLFLTGGVMLLYDPALIGNVAFQLSFLATFGIILANRKGKRQLEKGLSGQMLHWFRENLKLTLAAQVFTLPVIIYNFHRLSLIAPLTNLLIGWCIQPIMILGFLTSITGWIWGPLGVIPSYMVWVPLTYFISVIEILAKVPMASVSF